MRNLSFSFTTRMALAASAVVFAAALIAFTPRSTAAQVVVVVTSTADGPATAANCPGPNCRLRDALAAVVDGGFIEFSTSGTISLTDGEVVINKSVKINGTGAGALTINANDASRVFNIAAGTTVQILQMTLTGGHAPDGRPLTQFGVPTPGQPGGCILNAGSLTITNAIITGCRSGNGWSLGGSEIPSAGGNGGAVYSSGDLTLSGVTVSSSAAGSGGGAFGQAAPGGSGGAIAVSGTGNLTIDFCNINASFAGTGGVNSALNGVPAPNGDGAGVFRDGTGSIAVNGSNFSSNSRAERGGGISITTTGAVTITGSSFIGNSARISGGGIRTSQSLTVSNSFFSGNSAGFGGGALITDQPNTLLTVNNSTFAGNTAETGGGLYILDRIVMNRSTVSGNSASQKAGGLWLMRGNIDGSSIASNTSFNDGGGIYVNSSLVLSNSIVKSNVSGQGAPLDDGAGGGIFALSLKMWNNTVTGNTGNDGGGIYLVEVAKLTNNTIAGNHARRNGGGIFGALIEIGNTILANNTTGGLGPNGYQTVQSLGFNIFGDTSNLSFQIQPSDRVNVDPQLGPLGNYGGSTEIFPLLATSPAVNGGSNALAVTDTGAAITTDQRGSARIAGGIVDVGAAESPVGLVVTTTANSGPGSLRQILQTAASTPQDENISFDIPANDPNCTPGVGGDLPTCRVTLTSGEIAIPAITTAGSVFIQYLAPPTVRLTVSGNNASRVFNIASGGAVFMRNISATAGRFTAVSNAFGGAIYNDGSLTMTDGSVTNSTVAATTVTNGGGGIYTSGPLTLIRMTVSGNTITGSTLQRFGGGLMVNGGTTTLANCTFSSNSGNIGGGLAIRNGGIQATNITVTGNFANNNSGGSSGGFFARNSIISGNNSNGADKNLTGTLTGDSNIVGNETAVRLGPLGNQGGPTLTHALLAGSTAINAGNDCVVTATCTTFNAPVPLASDQRGAARVGQTDIGALEINNGANGGSFVAMLPPGRVGEPYSVSLFPSPGSFAFGIASGQLPAGLGVGATALSGASETSDNLGQAPQAGTGIAGTPTTGGLFNFRLSVSDGVNTAATDYQVQIIAPTSAGVSVEGRVLSGTGRGVANAFVMMTDADGQVRKVKTAALGYFRFDDVAAGQTVVLNVKSRRFSFAPKVLFLSDNLTGLDLVSSH